MDFHCIEALLGLPAFCVIGQVLGPQQLALHLERRDTSIVCPRCQTCCSQVKESRPGCIRDLPILELPVVLWLHIDRKSTRLNSSHVAISYAVFCLKKKTKKTRQ